MIYLYRAAILSWIFSDSAAYASNGCVYGSLPLPYSSVGVPAQICYGGSFPHFGHSVFPPKYSGGGFPHFNILEIVIKY